MEYTLSINPELISLVQSSYNDLYKKEQLNKIEQTMKAKFSALLYAWKMQGENVEINEEIVEEAKNFTISGIEQFKRAIASKKDKETKKVDLDKAFLTADVNFGGVDDTENDAFDPSVPVTIGHKLMELINLYNHAYYLAEGKCVVCGRMLTNKTSIKRSIGPICWEKASGPHGNWADNSIAGYFDLTTRLFKEYGAHQVTIVRETRKALQLKVEHLGGEFFAWVPKSCIVYHPEKNLLFIKDFLLKNFFESY